MHTFMQSLFKLEMYITHGFGLWTKEPQENINIHIESKNPYSVKF